MVVTNINQIVNNMILKRGYSIHWKLEFTLYARECLREIGMDDITIINTKIIPVNCQDNTFEIPNDYLDYVTVAIQNGQVLRPLVEADSVDSLRNYNSDWESVKLNDGDVQASNNSSNPNDTWLWYGFGQWFTTHFNSLGESVGRFYGGVAYCDTFKVLKQSNKIKINEALSVKNVVLIYISNGDNADAITLIDPYATQTIEEYILYQFKENNRTYNDSQIERQKQEYVAQRKVLRARVSDLSLSKLRRIVHRNSYPAPKS